MPRSHVLSVGAVISGLLVGCSGGQFHVDDSLGATAVLPVSGTFGLNNAHCHPNQGSREDLSAILHGLAANQEANVVVGDLSGTASAPHHNLDTDLLFGDAIRGDYDRFVRKLHATAASSSVLPIEQVLDGGRVLLSIPRRTTETMAFTFVGRRRDSVIVATCASTETARFLGLYDGPHFSMSCRIVSSDDGVPRDLRVAGRGTWAHYGFAGALRTLPPVTGGGGARVPSTDRAIFSSQDMSIAGMGVIRGFDLRSSAGQLAAVSFWQQSSENGSPLPRAWELGRSAGGWDDALATALAIAYVFPWPTACDDQYLREQVGKTPQLRP